MAGRRVIAVVLLLVGIRAYGESRLGRIPAPPTPIIHIRLIDLAGLPEKVRTQAEAVAADVFRRSGIDLDFVECLSTPGFPCRQPAGQTDFWLQILKQRLNHLHGDSTGVAILVRSSQSGDSYASVSYAMAADTAQELEVPVAEVLAASMAHEIGHLLLHSSAHSRTGIMSPRLDRKQFRLLERGELLFTSGETARLLQRAAQLAP